MKATFDFLETIAGEFKISLITTRDAISSSVYSLAGIGGSQSTKLLHPLEEKI